MENTTTNTLESVDTQQQPLDKTDIPNMKVKISDYGYSQAGLHQGDANSLIIHLGWIKEGHIVDEGFSEQEHLLGKKKAEANIQVKEDEKTKLGSEKKTLEDVIIPATKREIDNTKEDIKQVKIDIAEKELKVTISQYVLLPMQH